MKDFEFQELLAARTPYILANVHRRDGASEIPITHFLSPAVAERISAVVPQKPEELPPGTFMGKYGPVRIAPKGARPPSSRPPGVPDPIFDRLDAMSKRMRKA